jgi:hypothetical protein
MQLRLKYIVDLGNSGKGFSAYDNQVCKQIIFLACALLLCHISRMFINRRKKTLYYQRLLTVG